MHQVTVVDGDALRSVLRAVHLHFRSQRKAAEALGVGQPSFQKLLRGKTSKRIRADTLNSLLRLVRRDLPHLEEQVRSSVLTEEGARLLRLYGDWLRRSAQRLVPASGPLLRVLSQHPSHRDLFEDFLRKETGQSEVPRSRTIKDRRVRLALLRAVEPLAEAERTWGFEASWKELHDAGKLRPFLKHGLMRERLLLTLGERYLARINRLAASEDFEAPLPPDVEEAPLRPEAEFDDRDDAREAE